MTDEERNDVFASIVKDIEEGSTLIKAIKGRISSDTFYKWIKGDKVKAKLYAGACEARQDLIFEDIMNIADEAEDDTYTDENGKERTNNEVVQRSRLRIDARKWMLSKMNPKKYGDKIDHTTDGEKIEPTTIKWGGNDVSV